MQKDATSRRPVCVMRRQRYVSRRKRRGSPSSVKPLSKLLPMHKRRWTKRPFKRSGPLGRHTRRKQPLTMHWDHQAHQGEAEWGTEVELMPTFSLLHVEQCGLAHEIKHPSTLVSTAAFSCSARCKVGTGCPLLGHPYPPFRTSTCRF